MDEQTSLKLLISIHEQVSGIRAEFGQRLQKVEAGLDEHIRRTHNIEGRVGLLEKAFWMGSGAVVLASSIGLFKYFF
jgi:hypothetical protein